MNSDRESLQGNLDYDRTGWTLEKFEFHAPGEKGPAAISRLLWQRTPAECRIKSWAGRLMKPVKLSLCAIALSVATAAAAHADPRGLWLAQDGAKVRVSSCGKALCGRIAVAKSPTDPDTGKPWTDKNNPDPRLRGRPLVGVEVFVVMMPDGPRKWSGHLYSTNGGQTVIGYLYELGPKTIRVEGCAAANVCGGQNLTRIR